MRSCICIRLVHASFHATNPKKMKNFCWGGDGLLFLKVFSHLLKLRNNRSRTLFSLTLPLLFFLFSNTVSAQEPRQDSGADGQIKIQSLRVGEKVPEEIWQLPLNVENHPEGKSVVTLNDYKGKLILLDFWATWCKSCIEGFPKLNRIKEKFGDDIEILLVNCKQTKDSLENVKRFFERYEANFSSTPKFPSLVSDTIFQQLFPHVMIPQHAWISPEGNYIASTSITGANFNTISALLKGDTDGIKQFVDYDRNNVGPTLFVDTTGVSIASALLSYNGMPYDVRNRYTVGEFSVYQSVNVYLSQLIQTAFSREFKGVPKTHWYIDDKLDDYMKSQIVSLNNADKYTFQLVQRTMGNDLDGARHIRNDIQQLYNLTVVKGHGEREVFVVTTTPHTKKIHTSGGISEIHEDSELGRPYYSNVSLSYVLTRFNQCLSLPIVLEKIPKVYVDLPLPKALDEMTEAEILSLLRTSGLHVVKTRRVIDFLLYKPFKETKAQ